MTNIINFKDAIAKRDAKCAAETKSAEEIREEYKKAEHELTARNGEKNPGDPVSMLTELIIGQIVCSTAQSFDEMVEGMDPEIIKEIVQRMDENGGELAVTMLQSMFMITGDYKTVKTMDILTLCAVFDSSAYDMFIDDLFETEPFDTYLLMLWVEEGFEPRKSVVPVCAAQEVLNG